MWYADLSECDYFPIDAPMVAVGWLKAGVTYPTGPIDRAIYLKLAELLENPWQFAICGGHHKCDLCQFEAEVRGAKNLFVPHNQSVYACPSLIAHYINAHHYRPPEVFCEAVLSCPPMRSLEYYRELRRAGGPGLAKYLSSNVIRDVDRNL
jgi:hypothetical protein